MFEIIVKDLNTTRKLQLNTEAKLHKILTNNTDKVMDTFLFHTYNKNTKNNIKMLMTDLLENEIPIKDITFSKDLPLTMKIKTTDNELIIFNIPSKITKHKSNIKLDGGCGYSARVDIICSNDVNMYDMKCNEIATIYENNLLENKDEFMSIFSTNTINEHLMVDLKNSFKMIYHNEPEIFYSENYRDYYKMENPDKSSHCCIVNFDVYDNNKLYKVSFVVNVFQHNKPFPYKVINDTEETLDTLFKDMKIETESKKQVAVGCASKIKEIKDKMSKVNDNLETLMIMNKGDKTFDKELYLNLSQMLRELDTCNEHIYIKYLI